MGVGEFSGCGGCVAVAGVGGSGAKVGKIVSPTVGKVGTRVGFAGRIGAGDGVQAGTLSTHNCWPALVNIEAPIQCIFIFHDIGHPAWRGSAHRF